MLLYAIAHRRQSLELSMPLSSLIYKATHITIGIGDGVLVDSHIVAFVFKSAS